MTLPLDSRWLNAALVAVIALCRLLELRRSRANSAWSFARGGVEHGREHYPAMVALHAAFLLGCLGEPFARDATAVPAITGAALAVVLLCQIVRWWIIRTLGPQWNVRVIVVPGARRVTTGPYRWLSHPNYVIVALEGIALPAVHGSWVTAAAFTVLNAALMVVRLRVETRALATLGEAAR
jgi:methyltransferase